MTAKEYLLQAYLLEERIDSKLMQVERLRGLATKSTAIIRMDPGGGSGDGDFMENTIIRIVDMERDYCGDGTAGEFEAGDCRSDRAGGRSGTADAAGDAVSVLQGLAGNLQSDVLLKCICSSTASEGTEKS